MCYYLVDLQEHIVAAITEVGCWNNKTVCPSRNPCIEPVLGGSKGKWNPDEKQRYRQGCVIEMMLHGNYSGYSSVFIIAPC